MNIIILSMLIFSAYQTTIYAAEGGEEQQERRLIPRTEGGGEDQARQLALAEQRLKEIIAAETEKQKAIKIMSILQRLKDDDPSLSEDNKALTFEKIIAIQAKADQQPQNLDDNELAILRARVYFFPETVTIAEKKVLACMPTEKRSELETHIIQQRTQNHPLNVLPEDLFQDNIRTTEQELATQKIQMSHEELESFYLFKELFDLIRRVNLMQKYDTTICQSDVITARDDTEKIFTAIANMTSALGFSTDKSSYRILNETITARITLPYMFGVINELLPKAFQNDFRKTPAELRIGRENAIDLTEADILDLATIFPINKPLYCFERETNDAFYTSFEPRLQRTPSPRRQLMLATPSIMGPVDGLLHLGQTIGDTIGATTANVFKNLNHWWTSGVKPNTSMAGDVEDREIKKAEDHFIKGIKRQLDVATAKRGQLDAATAKKAEQQFDPKRPEKAVTDLGDFAEDAALDDQLARAIKQSAEEAGIPVPADEHSVGERARNLYSGLAAGASAAAQHGFMRLDDQPGHTPAAPDFPQAQSQRQRPRPAQAATTEELAAAAARERLAQQQALAAGPGVAYMQLDNVELDYTAGAAAAAYVPQRRPSRNGTHADAVAAAQQPSPFDTEVDPSTLSEDEQVTEAIRRSLLPQG